MRRITLAVILCFAAFVAWRSVAPASEPPATNEGDHNSGGAAGGVTGGSAARRPTESAGQATIQSIGPPLPEKPVLSNEALVCVDDESVLAPDAQRRDHANLTTRVNPQAVHVVFASRATLYVRPRLSEEYKARLKLELPDRQVLVLHETSTGENFYVDVPDHVRTNAEFEPSLFDAYHLRTGHTLALSFDESGILNTVAYADPDRETVEIPPATESQLLALFDSPTVPEPKFSPLMAEAPPLQTLTICGVSERIRVKRSGEIENATMTVQCVAGPSTNSSEFFILPLTP